MLPKAKTIKYKEILRALTLENTILIYFTISKSHFIIYTIPFYNTFNILNFYFSILLIKIIYLHNKIIYIKTQIKTKTQIYNLLLPPPPPQTTYPNRNPWPRHHPTAKIQTNETHICHHNQRHHHGNNTPTTTMQRNPQKNQRKIHSEPPSKPIGSWSPCLHQRCLHNHDPTQDQYPATSMAPCRHCTTTIQNPLPQIKTPHPHHQTPLQITERGHRWPKGTHRHRQHCQPPWQWSSRPRNRRWRQRGSRPRLCWCRAWQAAGLRQVFPWRLERH